MGSVDLSEALELLNLIALHELRLYDRAARRWLMRLLEEQQDLKVVDVQLARPGAPGCCGRSSVGARPRTATVASAGRA